MDHVFMCHYGEYLLFVIDQLTNECFILLGLNILKYKRVKWHMKSSSISKEQCNQN